MHCKLKQITVSVSGTLCYGITDELQSIQNAACRQARDGHQGGDAIIIACAPPASLAFCAAARRVQDCDSRPPVLV